MLTPADVGDLTAIFTDAQVDHQLTLYRYDSSGARQQIVVQGVQVAYPGRQPQSGASPGAQGTLSAVTFYREFQFDVLVGDTFKLDGHSGGRIDRVLTDPVLGVTIADGTLDTGR
jgi:hypothetical protein